MTDENCTLHDSDCFYQCCCNCVHHKPTHEHCTTNWELRKQIEQRTGKSTCICSIQNGWACCMPADGDTERVYTHWPEHSVGCECYQARKPVERAYEVYYPEN